MRQAKATKMFWVILVLSASTLLAGLFAWWLMGLSATARVAAPVVSLALALYVTAGIVTQLTAGQLKMSSRVVLWRENPILYIICLSWSVSELAIVWGVFGVTLVWGVWGTP